MEVKENLNVYSNYFYYITARNRILEGILCANLVGFQVREKNAQFIIYIFYILI